MGLSLQRLQAAGMLAPIASFLAPKEGEINATFHGEKAADIARLRSASKLFATYFQALKESKAPFFTVQKQLLGAVATSATLTAAAVAQARIIYPNLSTVTIVATEPEEGNLVIDDVRPLNEMPAFQRLDLRADFDANFSCLLSQIMRPIESLSIAPRLIPAVRPFLNQMPSLKELDFLEQNSWNDFTHFFARGTPLTHIERLIFRKPADYLMTPHDYAAALLGCPALTSVTLFLPDTPLHNFDVLQTGLAETEELAKVHVRIGACALTSQEHFHANLPRFQDLEELTISCDERDYMPSLQFLQDLQGLPRFKKIFLVHSVDWDFTAGLACAWKRALPHIQIMHKGNEVPLREPSFLDSCWIM